MIWCGVVDKDGGMDRFGFIKYIYKAWMGLG
jgi:hypothetical protein